MELLRRRSARKDLISFTEYVNSAYETAQHHRQIGDALNAVERGDVSRLMIFMPPRHGKSELASRKFPAYCLGRNPAWEVIAASYNSDLANDFGRDVRDVVNSTESRKLFPALTLRQDSRAVDRWQTETGGAYRAVGVGTAATGRGADLFLIDDPIKDRQEADSETTRDRVWSWYRSTAYTRLSPNGRIVVIQTRWHEDDLAGRLLNNTGGDKWEVLDLPALSAGGEALWPERFDAARLEMIRANIGPREWSALYQQRPSPDEGTYFKREWFKRHTTKPEHVRIYASSDYAVTEDGGDWTVHRIWGADHEFNLYLLDGWRGQTTADVWIERKIDLMAKWKPLAWFGEGGVIAKTIEPMLLRRMRERQVRCRLEWLPSIADKPTRARGFQARAAMGQVSVPDTPEGAAILDEYLRFPAGKHDDDVDCASLIGRALDEMHPAILPAKAVSKNPPDLWGRPKTQAAGWRVA